MLVGTSKSLLGKEWIITKAYDKPDGSVAIEGWISTPLIDMEKDILEPEAFQGEGLTNYFQKGAPISSEHNTTGYPVGYLQKAVLNRAGVGIIQEENNPRYDRAEFRFFDPLGTGWYGMGTIYEEKAANNVRKGTVGSFSWIGHPKTWEDRAGGGRRFSEKGAINPLLEVTITAYPINTAAIMRIAKAHGYVEEKKKMYVLNLSDVADLAMRPDTMRKATEREFSKGTK
jgi:hypothetical protein